MYQNDADMSPAKNQQAIGHILSEREQLLTP